MTSKDIKPVIEQPATEIPLMLAQVIIVAGVLAIGEIACSPLYFTLMDHSLALVPWALEAAFLAVAFTFVVGFALLWCAESFTFKLKEQFRLAKVGESVLTNGQVGAIALNGAALGFVAFLFAKLLDVKLGNRKTVAIILLIAEIVIAIIGLLIMIRMFSVLYAA